MDPWLVCWARIIARYAAVYLLYWMDPWLVCWARIIARYAVEWTGVHCKRSVYCLQGFYERMSFQIKPESHKDFGDEIGVKERYLTVFVKPGVKEKQKKKVVFGLLKRKYRVYTKNIYER